MRTSYLKRACEKIVKESAEQFPALIVTGPRQAGKTTLIKHLFLKSHRYVSLDNPAVRMMAQNDPELFFENYPAPVIIDEVQYAPALFPQIKIFIDRKRSQAGQFILTGSQLFPLMAKVSESLAGRIAVLTLLSFSLKEKINDQTSFNLAFLKNHLLKGGFPEVAVKKNINLELWFASYLQTYLERDVRQLRQIGDLGDFQKFLNLLAAFNGQMLNLSSFSRDLGVAVNTIKAWLAILETSGQIVLIKPFYLNKGKRIIKSPKIYFLDTGLLCYLSGITSIEQIFKGPFSGQLLETVALGEIIRNFYNQGRVPRLYWWRTSYGEEVDFVIEDQGRLIPLEIKMSARSDVSMARGLKVFCGLFADRIDQAFLVNFSKEKMKLDKKITLWPFFDFIEKFQGRQK